MSNSNDIFEQIPSNIRPFLEKQGLKELRPSQEKSIRNGLFTNQNNQLISAPTASGKTLVAELAMLDTVFNHKKKAVYILPLRALASEKYKEFRKLYGEDLKIRISIGDIQNMSLIYDFDLLIVTSEKLDSMIRHDKEFLDGVGLILVDEIHLLNDETRGPTLEILLSIFKTNFSKIRIVGLSATIGNPKELAQWLEADLIEDQWRPVKLEHHVLKDDELVRYK